jgi:hypothetical protein
LSMNRAASRATAPVRGGVGPGWTSARSV